MSYYYLAGVSSLAVGLGLAVYEGYQYVMEDRALPNDSGLKNVVISVASIALGVGLIYAGKRAAVPQMADIFTAEKTLAVNWEISNEKILHQLFLERIQTKEIEIEKCPIPTLQAELSTMGKTSFLVSSFKTLHETLGVSCDSYLPYKHAFAKIYPNENLQMHHNLLGRLIPSDLKSQVMWGITSMPFEHITPFIAFKYRCEEKTGVVALFDQGITNSCQQKNCPVDHSTYKAQQKVLGVLPQLFRGMKVFLFDSICQLAD